MARCLIALLVALLFSPDAHAQGGVKKRRPLPHEYGRVILESESIQTIPSVEFNHWLHRAKYTCRVCHVDIGFGMTANSTGITKNDIIAGYYCGVCHNGKPGPDGKSIFKACDNTKANETDFLTFCITCHSVGLNRTPKNDFQSFTANLPKARFGNGVDWEKAEIAGAIKLIDYIEGTSFKRQAIKEPNDLDLKSDVKGMPQIFFSHKKHSTWVGCEGCHPEIFKGVKKGATTYTMLENFDGKYCGQCHLKVAFPMTDCQRCHSNPVQ